MTAYCDQLARRGYTVVPCVPPDECEVVTQRFVAALARGAPELQPLSKALCKRIAAQDPTLTRDAFQLVGGGFSALGNPSSFHHKVVRLLRGYCHGVALESVFGPVLKKDTTLAYQAVVDRALLRPPGTTPTKESVHLSPSADAALVATYGGWLALNDGDYFLCYPYTHIDSQAEDAREMVSVSVPRGHLLIYDERLKQRMQMQQQLKIRLFVGHRLWHGEQDLDSLVEQAMRTQAPMFLKNGQRPNMYPKVWCSTYPDKIQTLTRRILPRALYSKAGLKLVMPSLKTLDLPLHVAYNASEKTLYMATRGPWQVTVAGRCAVSYTL